MTDLHLSLHGLPTDAALGEPIEVRGRVVRPLQFSSAVPALPVTFDDAFSELAKLDRLYGELDGSFVWVSNAESPAPFQFYGMLYDAGERLAYLELRGHGALEPFDAILTTCGWPESPLMFQLVREGIYLDESEFRRWANLRPSTA